MIFADSFKKIPFYILAGETLLRASTQHNDTRMNTQLNSSGYANLDTRDTCERYMRKLHHELLGCNVSCGTTCAQIGWDAFQCTVSLERNS